MLKVIVNDPKSVWKFWESVLSVPSVREFYERTSSSRTGS